MLLEKMFTPGVFEAKMKKREKKIEKIKQEKRRKADRKKAKQG